jgi:hypothetical protein
MALITYHTRHIGIIWYKRLTFITMPLVELKIVYN